VGIELGCHLFALMDAAEELIRPIQDRPCGWIAKRYRWVSPGLFKLSAPCGSGFAPVRVDAREILVELGRRRMVEVRKT